MKDRNWVLNTVLASGLTLVLASAGFADAKANPIPAPNPAPPAPPAPPAAPAPAPTPTPPQNLPDPPGTTLYMDKLRALFAAWDFNGDNFLDKAELAKAFRGPDAKPFEFKKTADPSTDAPKDPTADAPKDSTTTTKPDAGKYPDYGFLVQLDQDGDGRISRDEFLTWARDYAVQLKQQTDQETKLLAMEVKMQGASAKEAKTLEKEYKKEQAALTKMNTQMQAAEKALLTHLKHK